MLDSLYSSFLTSGDGTQSGFYAFDPRVLTHMQNVRFKEFGVVKENIRKIIDKTSDS